MALCVRKPRLDRMAGWANEERGWRLEKIAERPGVGQADEEIPDEGDRSGGDRGDEADGGDNKRGADHSTSAKE